MAVTPLKRRIEEEEAEDKANPLGVRPLGNVLFDAQARLLRERGLGSLARLPDELLLTLFATFDAPELLRIGTCSKACLAWSRIEGLWKVLYIVESNGRLSGWKGSWRASLLAAQHSSQGYRDTTPKKVHVRAPVCSDVLYQPVLCAQFDPRSIAFTQNIPLVDDVTRVPTTPIIISEKATRDWKAREWTVDNLAERFPNVKWRAEATLATMHDYAAYERDCYQDESPLYLFDADFVEKTQGELGKEYQVLPCFSDDLFSLLGHERPDYRWLIIGATRSGSTWHRDPNHTSAWNSVMSGSKLWLCFPPDMTPPGVHVSADESRVECPLSLAEWFETYWHHALSTYGLRAKDPLLRNAMRVGVCRAGETFCVPSRWWHLVVNLEPSIAITQNYVGAQELLAVLDFMRDKPDQVSGFRNLASLTSDGGDHHSSAADRPDDEKCDDDDEQSDEAIEALRVKFVDKIRELNRPDLAAIVQEHESSTGAVPSGTGDGDKEAFSFGFDLSDDELDD